MSFGSGMGFFSWMRHVKNNDNSDQDDDGNGAIMIAMIPEGEANKCGQMCFNDIYYLY